MESLLTKTYSPSCPDNDAITSESNGKAVLQVTPSTGARKTNKPSLSSTEMAGSNDRERAEEEIGITLGEPPTHCEPPSPRSADAPFWNRSSGLALRCQSRELLHEDRASYETPNTRNSPVTDHRGSDTLQKGESSSNEAEYGGQMSRTDEGQRSKFYVASEDVGQMSMVDIEEEDNKLISLQELKSLELLDISEFESDSSDSLLEAALPAPVSTASAAAAQSTSSIPMATTDAGSSSAQLNQSKVLLR